MKLSDYKSEQENNKSVTDSRLRNPDFKQKVRISMEHLGIQNTMKNFRKYDSMIDWEKTAENVQNPKKKTLVKPLWNEEPVDARAYIIEGDFDPEKYKTLPLTF